MSKEILDRIDQIHKAYPKPQCYLVAILLATRFAGEIWYDHNHCITLIEGNYYDKSGKVDNEDVIGKNYLPLDMYHFEQEEALMNALIKKHKEEDG